MDQPSFVVSFLLEYRQLGISVFSGSLRFMFQGQLFTTLKSGVSADGW